MSIRLTLLDPCLTFSSTSSKSSPPSMVSPFVDLTSNTPPLCPREGVTTKESISAPARGTDLSTSPKTEPVPTTLASSC